LHDSAICLRLFEQMALGIEGELNGAVAHPNPKALRPDVLLDPQRSCAMSEGVTGVWFSNLRAFLHWSQMQPVKGRIGQNRFTLRRKDTTQLSLGTAKFPLPQFAHNQIG
jgi:hypothetical protein